MSSFRELLASTANLLFPSQRSNNAPESRPLLQALVGDQSIVNMSRARREGSDPAPASSDTAEVATGVSNPILNVEHDLSAFAEEHAWDPNLEHSKLHAIQDALKQHDVDVEVELEQELEENSPYPEVVAAVQNWDDPSMPADTLRSWIIGMSFVTLGSGMNMLFSLRQPTIAIGNLVAQI
jgi:hypothetical protein